ncbi:hypothetical protein ACS0TY_030984 [Phlomoides rotata]
MIFHKDIATVYVLVLLCMGYNFLFVSGEIRCIDREREALLKFKTGLIDDDDKLSFLWVALDCCNWGGVMCSNTTGHVIALELHSMGGEINPALLQLPHLNYLDLEGNYFAGSRIPEFIGSMKQLQHLNLRDSNFSGVIPPQLGNLTNLRTLDLSYNYLWSENINWLSSLSQLSLLNLSGSNLSDANWLQPSLQVLHLGYCSLAEVVPWPDLFANSSSSSLSNLDLSSLLQRLTDSFGRLAVLDLGANKLEGEIPKSLGNSSHLQIISLSDNGLRGSPDRLIGNVSCKAMRSLEYVALNLNQFSGPIPDMKFCSSLRGVSLAGNNLTGPLPLSLGELPKLEILDLSFNSLEGTISEANFIKLHGLLGLDLSFNSLTMRISPDWSPSFQLEELYLARCKMGGHFPQWIQTQTNLQFLDLSDTGPIPLFPPNISTIKLSQNMFSGPISSICTNPQFGDMWLMDLSNNQLDGQLLNCWEKMPSLRNLNLANNSFSGEIPHSLGTLQNLAILHLRGNNLSGQIPPTLMNCRLLQLIDIGGNKLTGDLSWIGANYTGVSYLMLGDNSFYGSISPDICRLTLLQVLDLSRNNFSGEIPDCFNNFTTMSGNFTQYSLLPITYTYFVFNFPVGVTYVPRMNFDSGFVQWKGIGEMEGLESLDLSTNQLSGGIPIGLAQLHYLSVLDLANNNLSGQIPSSTQLQSFDASSYEGNGGLCGAPLPLCLNKTNPEENPDNTDSGLSSRLEMFISVFLGVFVGFWGFVASLVLKRSWRSAYFDFLNAVGDWFYVKTTLFFNKFRRS